MLYRERQLPGSCACGTSEAASESCDLPAASVEFIVLILIHSGRHLVYRRAVELGRTKTLSPDDVRCFEDAES
jgi:hypothetical protein